MQAGSFSSTHHQSATPAELGQLASKYKNVRVEKMDVTRKDEIDAVAAKLKSIPIDVLINNAGVYLKSGAPHSQDLGQFDYSLFDTIMAVNVRGPLMVVEAFVANVKASHEKKIVAISSTVGSLTQPFPGTGALFYRTSKAALNKEMQVLAQVLKPEGISVLLIHPGQVRTDRLASVAPAILTSTDYMDASQSVGQMIPHHREAHHRGLGALRALRRHAAAVVAGQVGLSPWPSDAIPVDGASPHSVASHVKDDGSAAPVRRVVHFHLHFTARDRLPATIADLTSVRVP